MSTRYHHKEDDLINLDFVVYTNALLATLNARKYLQLKKGQSSLLLGSLNSVPRSQNDAQKHSGFPGVSEEVSVGCDI